MEMFVRARSLRYYIKLVALYMFWYSKVEVDRSRLENLSACAMTCRETVAIATQGGFAKPEAEWQCSVGN
jgi:hypothetical protein